LNPVCYSTTTAKGELQILVVFTSDKKKQTTIFDWMELTIQVQKQNINANKQANIDDPHPHVANINTMHVHKVI
jgi:hypothetical protein